MSPDPEGTISCKGSGIVTTGATPGPDTVVLGVFAGGGTLNKPDGV